MRRRVRTGTPIDLAAPQAQRYPRRMRAAAVSRAPRARQKQVNRYAIASLAPLFAASIFGGAVDGTDGGDGLATHSAELRAWARGEFQQVLRVNPGDAAVHSRCELKLPTLGGPKPYVFSASSGSTGTATTWTGTKVST